MQEAQRATYAAPFRRVGRDEQARNVSLMQKRKVGQIRSLDWVLNVVERMRVREQNDLARMAFEDVVRIHRALSVAQNIEFYTYKVQFKLEKKSK